MLTDRVLRIKITEDKIYLQRWVENICEYLCVDVVARVEIIFKMIQYSMLIQGQQQAADRKEH